MEAILDKLDVYTRQWAMTLTLDDVAKLLQAVYKLPGLLETLKHVTYTPAEEPPNNDLLEKRLDTLASNTRTIMHLLTEPSAPAATIGKVGEDKFMKICRSLPVNYKVQDTSKQGKKGDFIITYTYMGIIKRCLVDVKNYTTTIPKKEVDKFFEDLSFGSYDAGLLISYNSKFVGIAEHIHIEEPCLPCGKIPVMYLSSTVDLLILQAIELIIAKSIIQQNKDVNIDRIESLIEHINNALSNSADVRRMLSELQTTVSKSVQKCQENLITHESHIKRSIREMSSCISKAMIQKIIPLVPVLEQRADNIDPDQPIQTVTDLPAIDLQSIETDTIYKVCKQDYQTYSELLELPWADIDNNPPSKHICELLSKNMFVKVTALKKKTTVFIDFQQEIEIPEGEFDGVIYKLTKDNTFVCQLNSNLVNFIKKYMDL